MNARDDNAGPHGGPASQDNAFLLNMLRKPAKVDYCVLCVRAKENNMAKIRHLVFQTTDPERLAKFYVDVMGLEIVHRSKNGGISLTDGYMNLSIHTNKIDGKPSGFNHFGFLVEDNEALAERFEKLGYRPPLKRPGDRHYAEYRAIDPDGNNFDISANGYDEIRPDRVPAKEKAS